MSDVVYLNEYKTHPFTSRKDFLNYLGDGNFNNILIALNAEKLMKDDDTLRRLVNQHVGYPDGIGTVMALKRKGYTADKIPGAEFWLDIIDRHYMDKTFYMVGGKSEVIEQTVGRLKEEYQGIDIVGYRDGYMDDQEEEGLVEEIKIKEPDIVFVAMGSPKQEFLMEKMFEEHPALYMGLGGSFDIYCGLKERAPKVFRKIGLEWFYRLITEPSRIRRQIVYLPFLAKVITNRI
ncbi:UDP-N-acetyl-D-mannosaminouronate:lipid I N-acetyl-D-mannosaminouronosyltransferase [Fodinibius salinus]|uniref:UDP-N-acetyl-D-mannosaminouronate:lipid I N-acetyl-D-mannosaminouronosyltransferase n=2 Tax=Fodinibius salinus TaxID=860790 RepID=A0A5D3YSS6_9BACT|nr:UDP-N-acetyl-D-mannosaminouronate:lipid I N-acetyl-D-mannosaminouronosyltransferase [Fodinibius salinus]